MTISRRDALGFAGLLLVLPAMAFAQGSAAVIEVVLQPPAAVVLPAGAVAKLRLFEGGVADHPNPPVFGRAEVPVGGLALPASLKLPISDAAGLARSLIPGIGVRIENSAGKLLYVNQRRHTYKPGATQTVILAPIVP
jgi:hypothetical protein